VPGIGVNVVSEGREFFLGAFMAIISRFRRVWIRELFSDPFIRFLQFGVVVLSD
jgi:hypothetical protein